MQFSPLLKYMLRRVMISLLVLVAISFVAFWMSYLLPSDPVTSRYPDITPELRADIRRQMGLDKPLPVQYGRFLQSVFRGEFGMSYNTGNLVIEDLKNRIPATLELAFFGFMLAVVLGIPTGIIAAVYRGRYQDHLMRLFSIGTLSIPSFWLGIVLIYFLYFKWRIAPIPVGRVGFTLIPPERVTGFYIIDSMLIKDWELAASSFKQLLMPAFVIGISLVAPIARITRSALSETLQEDFILFSRALGVPEKEVILKDGLRGSLVSILTIIGYLVGFTFAGSALVETVFAWPGLGRYAITAIVTSDMAPITSCILLVATGVAFSNLVVDILYAFIDPRIRYEYTLK